jgi:WD40 repeat protein
VSCQSANRTTRGKRHQNHERAFPKSPLRVLSAILILLSTSAFAPARSASALADEPVAVAFSVKPRTTLSRPKGELWDIVLSPNGKILAVVTRETKTELWNTETGKLIAKVDGRIFRRFDYSDIKIISGFSSDSRRLVTVNGKRARIWDAATGRLENTLTGFDDEVSSVAFSPDGKTIATGGKYGTVGIWSTESGKPLITFAAYSVKRHPKWRIVTRFFQLSTNVDVSFSPSGDSILTTIYNQPAKKWDANTRQIEAVWGDAGFGARFSPRGRYVLTANMEGSELWDTESGVRRAHFTAHRPVFSNDEQWLGLVQYEGKKGLLNLEHLKLEVPVSLDENDFNSWLGFSPNGEFFILESGLNQHSAKFINASTGEVIADVPVASKEGFDFISDYLSYTETLAFHAGSQVLMGANKKKVRFWEVKSGKQISELLEVRDPAIFSNDGKLLAATSQDKKSVLLWDVVSK